MTGDLAAFLAARLDEDEAQPWAVHDVTKCDALLYEEDMGAAAHEHVCDCEYPARVLREVAAKRAILDLHGRSHECSTYDRDREVDHCTWCLHAEECSTLRSLAAIYGNHPDYRQEWAP